MNGEGDVLHHQQHVGYSYARQDQVYRVLSRVPKDVWKDEDVNQNDDDAESDDLQLPVVEDEYVGDVEDCPHQANQHSQPPVEGNVAYLQQEGWKTLLGKEKQE